ncbi:Ion transport protein-domain-containing protein, partial [Zopfochytrium polystomum]
TFHDLSKRTTLFRTKLIDEFQLLDNLTDNANVQPPTHTSRDIADPKVRAKILLENPHQLIKFHVFKRTQQTDGVKTDRRLTRTRNINSLPIGAWAGWILRGSIFRNFVWFILLLDSIMIGISAELWPDRFHYWSLFQFISVLNSLSILVFVIEFVLLALDNHEEFFRDYWVLADIVVTLLTTVPELVELLGPNNQFVLAHFGELETLRCLRILKIAIRNSALRLIITTILQAFQSMTYIMLLCLIVTYIYAIVGVFLYKPFSESPEFEEYRGYFENIGNALRSLFQLLTLDQWDPINRELSHFVDSVWSQLYILSWVCLGAFIFRNIFVGAMVNNFDKISETLKAEEVQEVQRKKIEKMRKKLNKELALQGNIQRSITNLKAAVEEERAELGKSQESLKYQTRAPNVLQSIQRLLVTSQGISKGWEQTVAETLAALEGSQAETMWPRDTLFQYLQVMESLQENMKEYEELQLLARSAILELHD